VNSRADIALMALQFVTCILAAIGPLSIYFFTLNWNSFS